MNRNQAILQLMHTPGLGMRTLTNILTRLVIDKLPVEEFVSLEPSYLVQDYGLKPEISEGIQQQYDFAGSLDELLYRNEIQMIDIGSEKYPNRLEAILGNLAPPVLFSYGQLSILDRESVGFCGSRKASEKGLEVAYESAKVLADIGINVVSGYAHGVDLSTHTSSLEIGGVTTIVIATGILNFKVKKVIETLISDDNYLVISEFYPKAGWSVTNAMQRNRTICGLSDAVIVIESGLTGGTFEAGKLALSLGRPLFVAEYQNPGVSAEGNSRLIEMGAKPFRGNRNGKPNLSKVLEATKNSSLQKEQQESLFD